MDNIFGTAGIRALAGQFPLNFETLPTIGKILARFLINKYGPNANILIACDTRSSSCLIKALIKAGLLTRQLNIYDAQVLPTPVINYMVHELKNYDAGIIITASHNPYTDNGIKLVDRLTGPLTLPEELEISSAILNHSTKPALDSIHSATQSTHHSLPGEASREAWERILQTTLPANSNTNFLASGKEFHVRSITDIYTQKILDQFSVQISKQAFKNLSIVIDCANGATSGIAPALFTKLGIKLIAINTNPNGTNINANCGATHPAILQKTVLKSGALLGFAFDGDGDRIVAVTSTGEIKNGDEIIAFLATNAKYHDQTNLVGTVVSNLGLDLWLAAQNKKLIRTGVGEKNLLEAMQTNNCLIGGEPSGHIILKDFAKHSDAILVALKILETAIDTQNWSLQTFVPMPQVSQNILVIQKKDLNTPPLAEVINKYQNLLKPGRLVARYSGTENLLRLVLEGPDLKQLNNIMRDLSQELSCLLN